MAFCKVLDIYGAWLSLNNFILKGEWIFKISKAVHQT